ncbi:MAG: hypothetical protein ACE5G1_05765 [bacterium]
MDSKVKQRILAICDELGEDMDSPSCKKLREYVKTCPHCQAFVDSVKKTVQLYQIYTPKYSPEIHQRLFQKLHLE